MYFMGMYEFQQYMYADEKLKEINGEHELAIRRAYADIHPTRVAFNHDLGEVYSESINVAEYAIWLIDVKEGHSKQREHWRLRTEAFGIAVSTLTSEELLLLHDVKHGALELFQSHRLVIKKLKKKLEQIIASRPSLRKEDDLVDCEVIL